MISIMDIYIRVNFVSDKRTILCKGYATELAVFINNSGRYNVIKYPKNNLKSDLKGLC